MQFMKENIDLIKEYISEEECRYICFEKLFNCDNCANYEECYLEAEIKCNDDFNNVFAKSVDYGGYNNQDDFWEQLLN